MEKICLIKAGKFLLGLNNSNIISTLPVNKLQNDEIDIPDLLFIHLESFLSQKQLDLSGSEIIVLKQKKNKKHLALLIDKSRGEIMLPDRFEPCPLLYPELAKKCCHKIFLHEDQVILLLEPTQISKLHKTLKTDHGFVTLDDFMPVQEEISQDHEQLSKPDSSDIGDLDAKIAKAEPETKIDDKTVKKIVFWTFNEFNKFDSSEKITILADNLPPEIIEQQTSANNALQEIIDQTIEKCKEIRYQRMKNMIKEKLNKINF